MPIEVSTDIKVYDQEEFHALDRRIMGVIFNVHNEFGRLLDEKLYKVEIAARCVALGLLPAEREVRIRVSHGSFAKDYFIDLLFCHGIMVEAKVVEGLVAAHRGQALNYLLLAGMQHGRLVNLRPERVEHEYVSTTLTPAERRRLRIEEHDWIELNEPSCRLKQKTMEILNDWGAFLDVNLYREALIHFLGGPDSVGQAVAVFSGSRQIGAQNFNLLDADTAFAITAKKEGIGAIRDHLDRLLHHTPLNGIQWINLNGHSVEFTTLAKATRINAQQNHGRAES